MTELEEIKKGKHPDRIWATVNGMSTRLPDGARQLVGGWSQDAERAGSAEYVLASTLASLQRDNERLSGLIRDNGTPRFNAVCERAEAAEGEVKRLTEPEAILCECTKVAQDETCPVGYPSLLCEVCDGKGVLSYVGLDGPELWEIVFGVNSDAASEITDEQYDRIAKHINDVFIAPLRARTAHASTGGEHHADK